MKFYRLILCFLVSTSLPVALLAQNFVEKSISIDDFAGLNTETNKNNLRITKSQNGLQLTLGPGSSTSAWDAFGTGTSKFGQSGEWFDGSYVKFGNSGNQQKLDFRLTNETGDAIKLKRISFDIRRPPSNSNPTDFELIYLDNGDSALIKGSTLESGSEMINLAGLGSADIDGGINYYREIIGDNISGTAWIANDGYANIRLLINTDNTSASSQLDNLLIEVDAIEVVSLSFTSSGQANAIDENSGANQVIYTAVVMGASGAITYTLKSVDDYASFTIDSATGEVSLTGDPDYETKSSYSFTVVASDTSTNTAEKAITLDINDLDDAAPLITSGTSGIDLVENTGAGQTIYTITATDETGVSSYAIGGTDSSFLTLAGNVVSLNANPDYETKDSYKFTVTATDAAGNTSTSVGVIFDIINLDDTGPVFTSPVTASAIAENSGANQVVYTAVATDASGSVTYTLKSVDDYASFTIDNATGEVSLTGDPDYETKSSYSFTVFAADPSGNPSEQAVTLDIIDLDDTAPVFTSPVTASAIAENSGPSQAIYTALTDDSGAIYTLKSVDDYASFTIDTSTGVVTLTSDPDYETKSSYSFTVLATDILGNPSEQAVTLDIIDLDDTAPVFTSGSTALSIAENSGANQVVYTAVATDASGSVTYTLKSVDDYASFTIDNATGEVSLTGDPDYETKSSYSFTVFAADPSGNSSEQAVTLDIINLDDTGPVFTSPVTASAIAENSGANQVVYTAVATDASGSVTYALKSVDDYASFTIDTSTGVITLIENPDGKKSSYHFTVSSTDAFTNISEISVTLIISSDVIAPVFTSPVTASAIAENSGANQVVYTAVATDASGSVTYTLKSVDDYASFTIDNATGEVSLTGDPDYETKSSYSFTVFAADPSGNPSEQAVTLDIIDLDDTAPVFTSPVTASAIAENSGPSQAIYTALTDDSGAIYTLKSVDDYASFTIDTSTGVVTLTSDPDYETKSSYSFTVLATDILGNPSEQAVTLDIIDLDDTAPVFTSGSTALSIAENSGANQVVYTAVATDASGSVTYTLKSVDDYASFTIDNATGEVSLTGDPDYETKSSYSFTVFAADPSGNPSEQAVTLDIIDLDDTAPVFTSPVTASAIAENSGPSQAIYTALTDDSGAIYTLKSVDDYASFTIDTSTGVVTLTSDPDYETKSSYSFTVLATDILGNPSEQAVTLDIIDLDDTAPVFTSGSTALSIAENSGANQVVYTAVATDASGSVTYTLKSVDDYASFTIDNATGEVSLTGDPDYETKSSYSFTVFAADPSGNSSEQAVTLDIIDLDDTAPVFTSGSTALSIAENSGANQVVYTAVATDASGSVTYTLKSVDDYASFTIDTSTGVVTLTSDPDYETKSSYSFTVLATDILGNPSEQALALAIVDVDETWDAGAVKLGNSGWRWTSWFGYFNVSTEPWIYHQEHSWLYILNADTPAEGLYFWDFSVQSILWTSEDIYPVFYRFSDGRWIWYFKGSRSPRWFVNLANSEWEEY